MAIARSKLTAKGRTTVPAEIRKRLGVAAGTLLEWVEKDGEIIVRRARKSSWRDVRKILFPDGPPAPAPLDELSEGRRRYVRRKQAHN